MDVHLVSLAVIGLAFLLMSWMPVVTARTSVSYPILYVLAGMFLYRLFTGLPVADPLIQQKFTLHFSELIVIISLMGTGLKIDEPFRMKTWVLPFRLAGITMVLSICFVAFLCHYFLKFDWPTSILIGAVLAPTDPVLANDVQVGPPMKGDEGKVRFSLTAEAGMNDGMAFPFTWLAIILATSSMDLETTIAEWLWKDLLLRTVIGVVAGFAIGRLLAYLFLYLPGKYRTRKIFGDGFIAISATLLVYSITELMSGYGFVAVFVSAITLRNYEMDHAYHTKLHDFADQVERMLIGVVLLLFGGAIASGLLQYITWPMAVFAVVFLVILRPLAVLVSIPDIRMLRRERLAISFLGIKGIGSFFYLAFALEQAEFVMAREIWSLVGLVVLLSIIIHGLSANRIIRRLPEAKLPARKQR